MRMNNLKPHVIMWISLTNIMLNERNPTHNSTYCMVKFYKVSNKKNYSFIIEVRILGTSARKEAQKTFQGSFLFPNLDAGHMGVVSL